MQSQVQFSTVTEIIKYLSQQFPKCFTLDGEAKPLKLGIFQDIIARLGDDTPLSNTKLRYALRIYTMNWRYLYSIKEGAYRVNLDGEQDELITKEHVDYAKKTLKESKEKKAQKFKQNNKDQVKKKSRVNLNTHKNSKTLQIGDMVKVKFGSKLHNVQITNIEKEHIKVKVASGIELTIKPEHIITK